jgi:hypothetical protein
LNSILAVAVFEKMLAEISSELKGAILALHGEGLSRRKILKALFDQRKVVSSSTVDRLIIRQKKRTVVCRGRLPRESAPTENR